MEQFLKEFYEAISFEAGKSFKGEAFRNFFMKDASLFEKEDHGYHKKSVEDEITEFDSMVKNYPELFTYGFTEKQLSYRTVKTNAGYLVSSDYEKIYANAGERIMEFGTNDMIIVCMEEGFKIASMMW